MSYEIDDVRYQITAPFNVLGGDHRSDTINGLPPWDTRGIDVTRGDTLY